MKTYRLIVSGRVQGVNYRKFVHEVALALQYKGCVRNLMDKTVEVIVNAEFEEDLEFFISKLYEGSLFSDVRDIQCVHIDTMLFETFKVV